MNIAQIESSFALLLPDLVALLATLADSTDESDVMLVKHVRIFRTWSSPSAHTAKNGILT